MNPKEVKKLTKLLNSIKYSKEQLELLNKLIDCDDSLNTRLTNIVLNCFINIHLRTINNCLYQISYLKTKYGKDFNFNETEIQ